MINKDALISELNFKAVRSSGSGGQNVNKVSSKIELAFNLSESDVLSSGEKDRLISKLSHRLTKEYVLLLQCDESRSQHKNKATAMKMLKSRLYELELEAQKAEQDGISKSEIGWGHQIRSYVMQPYQQVKDTRSNEALSNISGILDGDIDAMIEGVLIAMNKS